MIKKSKLIGCTFMVVGTAIGAGMLALPMISSAAGFILSTITLISAALLMLTTAFLTAEVNFAFPEYKNNFNTMAQTTLGPLGKFITWLTSLLLLYTLIAAYILGNASLLTNLFLTFGINIPTWVNALLFVIVLGGIIFWSTKAVDYFNRGLLSFKGIFLIAALALLFPYVDIANLTKIINLHEASYTLAIIPIFAISFGFHSVIPTIRNYIGSNRPKELKIVMICGVIAIATIYFFWLLVVLGSIPLTGEHSFTTLAQNQGSVGEFVQLIGSVVDNKWAIASINGFANIAMTTSFLGVSIGLFDFLAEGFKRSNTHKGRFQTWLLTFIPPLIFALFYPQGFILALGYTAIFVAVLWIILPALMAYRLRSHASLSSPFRVLGGKFLLIAIIIIGIGIIILQILTNLKLLPVL